ncbi:MAG: aminopeptidase P family protein [Flavobacteriaceae bacterium]
MKIFTLLFFFLSVSFGHSQILKERERALLKDELLEDRFNNLLPKLMDKTGIDMWLLISREYNEDPVLKTMLPATWLNARRRTIIVFYRNKEKDIIERLAIARYNIGKSIKSAWNKEKQPDQWKALEEIIKTRNPKKIGINTSRFFPLADGLVKTDYEELKENMSPEITSKFVSAEQLAIAWIETRTEKEMKLFRQLVKITHEIIDEAFSDKVIQPGKTTTDDVVWWMRQKVTDLGLEAWFHPTIDIQRTKEELKSHIYSFTKREKEKTIQKGDLLHCDFGITYIGLNTDCQQHAYVLKKDEKKVPSFLQEAFKKGNRLQDILTKNMKAGKTGNEILLNSLSEAKSEGLKPAIYTHPLGKYGHSAGTTIGLWDSQEGVPVRGAYALQKNTTYAIELNVTVQIKEWQKNIRIMLEEAGFFGDNFFEYVNGRQTKIKPIKI